MSSPSNSIKLSVVKTLMHYSYNYRRRKNDAIDLLLGRWPGDYLFKKYVVRWAYYRAFRESLACRIGQKFQPRLQKKMEGNVDLLCHHIASDILKQKNVRKALDHIEMKLAGLWDLLDNRFNPEEGSSAAPPAEAFWFNYMQDAAYFFINDTLRTIRMMNNRSEDNRSLVISIAHSIKRQLPVEFVQQFGDDIDALINLYFYNQNLQKADFKNELALRIKKHLLPKLAEEIKPVVEVAIPFISKLGNQIVQKNTKDLNDWVFSQAFSFVSSVSVITTFLGAACFFYDPALTVRAMTLLFIALAVNFGMFCSEFRQTQRATVSPIDIKRQLKENYGGEFKKIIANCLANFHNQFFGRVNPKSPDDFIPGISDGLIDGILFDISKKVRRKFF